MSDHDETHLHLTYASPHARGHRIGTGKCAGWRHHGTWNQKSKIRCNKAGGTLPPGQRLLVLVEAAFLAWRPRPDKRPL